MDGGGATGPDSVGRGDTWRIGLSWVSGILILAAVVLVATRSIEIEQFAELARKAKPIRLLAAMAAALLRAG